MPAIVESEVLVARQCFEDAQRLLEGSSTVFGSGYVTLGWYGTRVSAERGSFAVVNAVGPLAGLVGDVVRFRYGSKSALVYVIGSADLPYDFGVTRRVFAAVELLAVDVIEVSLEVVSS